MGPRRFRASDGQRSLQEHHNATHIEGIMTSTTERMYLTGSPPQIRWAMTGHRPGSPRAYAYLLDEIVHARWMIGALVQRYQDDRDLEEYASYTRILAFLLAEAVGVGLLTQAQADALANEDERSDLAPLRMIFETNGCGTCSDCLRFEAERRSPPGSPTG
jgi:hypothetical protein